MARGTSKINRKHTLEAPQACKSGNTIKIQLWTSRYDGSNPRDVIRKKNWFGSFNYTLFFFCFSPLGPELGAFFFYLSIYISIFLTENEGALGPETRFLQTRLDCIASWCFWGTRMKYLGTRMKHPIILVPPQL